MQSVKERLAAKLGKNTKTASDAPTNAGATVVPIASAERSQEAVSQPQGIPDDILAEVEHVAGVEKSKSDEDKRRAAAAAKADLLAACHENQYGEFGMLVRSGGRLSWLGLGTEAGMDFAHQTMQAATGKAPPKTEKENLLTEARNAAREAGRRIVLHQRIARTATGTRVLDLGDTAGRIVAIEAAGWRIESNDSIAFKRGRGYGALPDPIKATSARAAFVLLFDWLCSLGIPKGRAPLVLVALVTWLRTGNAYPLLLLFGTAGSGKTTAGKLIVALLDPSESLAMPTVALDDEHVAAAAQHRHILTFDNESKLTGAEQDLLCICATGGEIIARRLYSNSDIVTMPLHRPVIITALQPVVTRPDLMTRTIPIEFKARDVRRGDDEILAEFLEARPELLGALLELAVLGERNSV